MSTIAVVAVDAADIRLLKQWGCEDLLLETNTQLGTFSHSSDQPHTLEVWPTVATGLSPDVHGVTADQDGETSWQNPVVELGKRITGPLLPNSVRTEIGERLLDSGAEATHSFPTTDSEHVFDEVYMWPGLTPAAHLGRSWDLLNQVRKGEISSTEFETELFALTHDELNWAASQNGLVGVHCHVLDAAGHAFCESEAELRHYYERFSHLIRALETCVEDIVLVSDHGMQVSWLDDEDPGTHSFDATFATTIDADLPESVTEVADWLRTQSGASNGTTDEVDIDATREQLENLGYLS